MPKNYFVLAFLACAWAPLSAYAGRTEDAPDNSPLAKKPRIDSSHLPHATKKSNKVEGKSPLPSPSQSNEPQLNTQHQQRLSIPHSLSHNENDNSAPTQRKNTTPFKGSINTPESSIHLDKRTDAENNNSNSSAASFSFDPERKSLDSLQKTLPTELLLEIMKYKGVAKALAPVSRAFHQLSCHKTLKRTLFVDSVEKLQIALKPRNPSGQYQLPSFPALTLFYTAQFTKKDFQTLFEVHPCLLYLGLIEMGVSAVGGQFVAGILTTHTSLLSLRLHHNSVGPDGSKAIAEALMTNPILTCLNMEFNEVGDEGCQAIMNMLETNSSLKKLSLRKNKIGDGGGQAIGKALTVNTTLKKLDLGLNWISNDGAPSYQ